MSSRNRQRRSSSSTRPCRARRGRSSNAWSSTSRARGTAPAGPHRLSARCACGRARASCCPCAPSIRSPASSVLGRCARPRRRGLRRCRPRARDEGAACDLRHGFLRLLRNHSKSPPAAAVSPPRFGAKRFCMTIARRTLLKTALSGATSLALGAPAFAQSAAEPFPKWVETFRAKARAKGISDATYTRVMGNLKPDESVFTAIRSQPEFNQQLWQYINRRVSDWRIQYGQERAREIAPLLARIEKDFGVERAVILGLWGIEFDLRRSAGEAVPFAAGVSRARGARLGRAAPPRLLGNRAHQCAAHRGKRLGHAQGHGRLMGGRDGPYAMDAGGLAQSRPRL